MYHQVLHTQIKRSAHTVYLCILYESENKQRLFPYIALTDWFLQERFNPVKPGGYYMYHQFNIQQSTFCPQSVFVCFVWICELTAIISIYSVKWF